MKTNKYDIIYSSYVKIIDIENLDSNKNINLSQ